ncbi:MAG: tRNA pseudouridine(38-40) synthase TruA [Bacteroidales bacterium]|nr:tRNA pseudouridine(38-40) synthase TruA [Bacteroidales bacterium]MCF6342043.1 tRNA pseudouridine(38-40) synthase TruA [Bacteroidales bacterium]
MSRYFIRLAYDGTNYHGWQVQKNAHSVQAELNDKLSTLLNENINVMGCGRTDTGVHAREFFAHFDVNSLHLETKDLAYKMNRFLPEDIAIDRIFKVEEEMHARFSATSRTYKYFICRKESPFDRHFSYFLHVPLDLGAMQHAAEILLCYEDFTSFSRLHTQTATNLCRITEIHWETVQDKLVFTITADRFLRNMVRAIVGTLLEIGMGKLRVGEMQRIIEAKDRSQAGFSVPAKGLFLERVVYPGHFNIF